MTLLPIADKVSNNQDSVVANAFNNEPNMRKLQSASEKFLKFLRLIAYLFKRA